MALNLRAPHSDRYAVENDEGPSRGPRLGAAVSDWDREDAARNAGGFAGGFDEPSESWRRWVRVSFGVLALAGFVGVLWYAYEWGLGGGETVDLPTVQAEPGPEKEKPSDPGGLKVPYQDQLVMNQDGGQDAPPRVERLLPPPEAPALTAIAPSYDEVPEGAAVGDAGTLQPAGAPAAADTGAKAAANESVPKLPPAPSAQAGAGSQNQAAAAEGGATQSAAAQPTKTQSAAATAATAPASSAAAGEFAVQLMSLKDADAAKKEWRRLQGVFPDLLGDKSLLLQTADVANVGTVYRLRAGPFATRAKAATVCAELKAKRQDCLVVNR